MFKTWDLIALNHFPNFSKTISKTLYLKGKVQKKKKKKSHCYIPLTPLTQGGKGTLDLYPVGVIFNITKY